jgi:hypothetical protein
LSASHVLRASNISADLDWCICAPNSWQPDPLLVSHILKVKRLTTAMKQNVEGYALVAADSTGAVCTTSHGLALPYQGMFL